jgi:hypothetical protein
MPRVTALLARGIGLFTVLLVAAFMVRGGFVIAATAADGPVMLTYAIISLAIGVAMIVGHNVWSGGVLPVVVTLVGWLIFLKGLTLCCFRPMPSPGHSSKCSMVGISISISRLRSRSAFI